MKKLIVISIIIAILAAAGYAAFKSRELPKGSARKQPADEAVAIYFKNGSVMIGELLSKTEDRYLVRWKGEETIVYTEQVERIGNAKDALKKKELISNEEITKWWPYENDIVVRLTNRVVADARISRVAEDKITLLYPEGTGYIEQDIERSRVEYLIFKPIDNPESIKIEKSLKKMFPEMEFYKEGNFTIVTDSYDTWVSEYKKTLRWSYTNTYLKFFNLFKDRKPRVQNFIVIFDDYADFVEYAISEGVPGWAVAGYFSPDKKTLYLFNVLGDKFSEILFEAMVGESGRTIDDIVDRVEGRVDKRYHIFIEGQAKRIKDKFWDAYSYFKSIYREATISTLRHEFTHEVFYNWGLQNIELSKFEEDEARFAKKKKEILGAKDLKEKAKLIKSLISLESEPLEMKAANSWLVEGLATYCETDPIGSQNDRWLSIYQEMARQEGPYPLASLTFHRMGSFPGVSPKSVLRLYAQSWAYVTFLMEKYPEQFRAYQKRMSEEIAQGHEDLEWLLQALGKDLRTIEKEFVEYMDTYEEVEDPYVSSFVKLHNMFNDIY